MGNYRKGIACLYHSAVWRHPSCGALGPTVQLTNIMFGESQGHPHVNHVNIRPYNSEWGSLRRKDSE
jgi:hypothetical protein